jgi:hypothetical protein
MQPTPEAAAVLACDLCRGMPFTDAHSTDCPIGKWTDALATLDAIAAIHRRVRAGEWEWCADCRKDWPCPTAAALAAGGTEPEANE